MKKNYKYAKAVMVRGRHEIVGVNNFIFDAIDSVLDYGKLDKEALKGVENVLIKENANALELYVTGLSTALQAIINVCIYLNIPLDCMNYDAANNNYKRYSMNTNAEVLHEIS